MLLIRWLRNRVVIVLVGGGTWFFWFPVSMLCRSNSSSSSSNNNNKNDNDSKDNPGAMVIFFTHKMYSSTAVTREGRIPSRLSIESQTVVPSPTRAVIPEANMPD